MQKDRLRGGCQHGAWWESDQLNAVQKDRLRGGCQHGGWWESDQLNSEWQPTGRWQPDQLTASVNTAADDNTTDSQNATIICVLTWWLTIARLTPRRIGLGVEANAGCENEIICIKHRVSHCRVLPRRVSKGRFPRLESFRPCTDLDTSKLLFTV